VPPFLLRAASFDAGRLPTTIAGVVVVVVVQELAFHRSIRLADNALRRAFVLSIHPALCGLRGDGFAIPAKGGRGGARIGRKVRLRMLLLVLPHGIAIHVRLLHSLVHIGKGISRNGKISKTSAEGTFLATEKITGPRRVHGSTATKEGMPKGVSSTATAKGKGHKKGVHGGMLRLTAAGGTPSKLLAKDGCKDFKGIVKVGAAAAEKVVFGKGGRRRRRPWRLIVLRPLLRIREKFVGVTNFGKAEGGSRSFLRGDLVGVMAEGRLAVGRSNLRRRCAPVDTENRVGVVLGFHS
jgi:hypothetical protein